MILKLIIKLQNIMSKMFYMKLRVLILNRIYYIILSRHSQCLFKVFFFPEKILLLPLLFNRQSKMYVLWREEIWKNKY